MRSPKSIPDDEIDDTLQNRTKFYLLQGNPLVALCFARKIRNSANKIYNFIQIAAQLRDKDRLESFHILREAASIADDLLSYQANNSVSNKECQLALLYLAEGYAFFGEMDKALQTLPQGEGIIKILDSLARGGYTQEALAYGQTMSDISKRLSIYMQLVKIQLEFGKLPEAIEVARQYQGIPYDGLLAREIIDYQLKNHDISGAIETLTLTQASTWKNWAIADVAQAEAKQGNIDEALLLAKDLHDQARYEVLIAVAVQKMNQHDAEAAFQCIQQIKKYPAVINSAYLQVIQAQARNGNLSEAVASAQLYLQIVPIAHLTCAAFEGGHQELAIQYALQVADPVVREQTLHALAQKLHLNGNLKRAMEISGEALLAALAIDPNTKIAGTRTNARSEGLWRAASTAVLLLNLEQALGIAKKIKSVQLRDAAFQSIVDSQGKSSLFSPALLSATLIKSAVIRSDAIVSIVVSQCRANDINAAKATAKEIPLERFQQIAYDVIHVLGENQL